MKRIHVLQHTEAETPGFILHWASDMGYSITQTKFFEDYTFPPIEAFDFLVIMGGPMSVNDIRDYPWLKEEIAFIKRAIDSDKIIIGICLGAQLIARALGAIVKKNDYKEIGWHRIYKTGTQTEVPVFDCIPDGAYVFHWHGETFEIPDGATHIFYSDACRNQAFIYKDRVIALQFHPEVTFQLINNMIADLSEELNDEGEYIQNTNEILEGVNNICNINFYMHSILDKLDKL
ncbi:MAG TPA: type 1 glutamine amidotransferase [Spirochaetota bacterium]|nr:type 1 glutamine amidotransferase [Spirochaetota bacterium]